MNNGAGIPIVACDIDGTLGDYHGHFLQFAEGWFGFSMPDPTAINPGMWLWEFMGVPLEEYRQCKLAYRQGGLKRTMPVYPGAGELSRAVRAAGAHFWITTTRPYLRLDNIDPDTREWLRRNQVEYDGVLFGDDKYHELKRQVGERVVVVFDDLPEAITEAEVLGFRVLIRDQPYNKHVPTTPRVLNCGQMQQIAITRIAEYQREQQRRT